jgi:hypothetical protein
VALAASEETWRSSLKATLGGESTAPCCLHIFAPDIGVVPRSVFPYTSEDHVLTPRKAFVDRVWTRTSPEASMQDQALARKLLLELEPGIPGGASVAWLMLGYSSCYGTGAV